ncbi:MAG: hypothetical protein WCD87_14210, partial [Pseudolabrys sp.]
EQWHLAVRRFWHKADIGLRGVYVCFLGQSGHQDLRRLLLGLFMSRQCQRTALAASQAIVSLRIKASTHSRAYRE